MHAELLLQAARPLIGPRYELFTASSLFLKHVDGCDQLTASSTNVNWTSCLDTFKCGKLTVPLQYSDPAAGEAQIALIMSPSNFSADDPNYLGSILFNPGGPGGSGVSFVEQLGTYFRAIVGPQYDLVGFDPRGVGQSTPVLSLFKTPVEAFEYYSTYPQNVNESISSFGRFYAQANILGKFAADRYQTVAESVSTAAVATDMLNIAKALGQDKVNYWGVSYGSILGATFAAMFPNNVGRFIIDGVFNSHQWYRGDWSGSLLNTDAALTAVYEACVAAGPSLCALHSPDAATIRARVDTLISSLHLAPQPVYDASDPSSIVFGVADYTVLVLQLFQMLYTPFGTAPAFFAALAALERGNASAVYRGSVTAANTGLATCAPPATAPFVVGFLDVSAPISCGDIVADADRVRTPEQARQDYAAMANASALFATTWYPLSPGRCAQWPIKAKDVFNGSFTQNTSNPILLITNTHDPVTPMVGALNMSSGFAGSVVLQQNSTGHTSLSGFSTCTAEAIHAYFANGTLPAPDTLCQTDTLIFESPSNSSGYDGVTITPLKRAVGEGHTLKEAARMLARSDFVAKSSGLFGRRW
ncbi:alpha/beta hydrolase [Phanerochaete sordida]|uniref:Alpha/beta hydrolase n=1 Tax=Phanerochaete sordida TaxID=48140 RepID=A0A9P3G404_9APHY|nr:alpha/beta hydrolase [Phanerochaete sordida]